MNLSAFFARLLRRGDPILEARDPGVVTLISVVYSTAPKTFAGPATYITVTNGRIPAAAAPTAMATQSEGLDNLSSLSDGSAPTTSSSSNPTTSSTPSAAITPSPTPATHAPATTSTPTTGTTSPGMTGGAKAGLAFGILILIGALLAAILFIYRQRKHKQEGHERLDDEKAFFAAGKPDALPSHATPATNHAPPSTSYRRPLSFEAEHSPISLRETGPATTPSTTLAPPPSLNPNNGAAPQLSLRAVSSFEPGLALNPVSSAPNTAAAISASVAAAAASGAALSAASARNASDSSFKSAWEKPGTSNAANDPANPFGNHAEKVSAEPSRESGLAEIAPPPPAKLINAADFPLPESVPATPRNFDGPPPNPLVAPETAPKAESTHVPEALVAGGAAVTGAAAIAAAVGAAASNKPQGTSTPPTPVVAPGPAPDNVHRVQLEFKPSMGDELEILAGQLVRVLHEYDDGWALCQKMDRSAQGVVPRTCLSKHPVKPRPASPSGGRPRGPPMRNGAPGGPPPFAQPPRPHSSASGRNSPGPGRMSPAPGRMSPTSGRMSPGPGRNSPAPYAQAPRPLTPTGRARANSSSSPFVAYQPQARSQSPGPNGGSRLRPQESSPAVQRRRSNSMGQVSGTSGLRNENTTAPAPLSKIPTAGGVTRKPVPGEDV